MTGESGGGNLSLATALKAKRDGRLDRIDGVYAQVPFIYGAYDTPDPALPSLIENEGYFLGPSVMTLMAAVYDPTGEHATEPAGMALLRQRSTTWRACRRTSSPPTNSTPCATRAWRTCGRCSGPGSTATGHTYSGVGHAGELIAAAAVPELFDRALARHRRLRPPCELTH